MYNDYFIYLEINLWKETYVTLVNIKQSNVSIKLEFHNYIVLFVFKYSLM